VPPPTRRDISGISTADHSAEKRLECPNNITHFVKQPVDLPILTSREEVPFMEPLQTLPHAELEQRSAELRSKLKDWERAFAAAHNGRKAAREDIKQHPEIGWRLHHTGKIVVY